MTSYGYIAVDSCIILINLNYIMQLKQFYNIATKVSSRKSATTFGDLPDWSMLSTMSCDREVKGQHVYDGTIYITEFEKETL